jgi:hypothetical protein
VSRNNQSKTEGGAACGQQGARRENTPVFDRRATPLAVRSDGRIGLVILRHSLRTSVEIKYATTRVPMPRTSKARDKENTLEYSTDEQHSGRGCSGARGHRLF